MLPQRHRSSRLPAILALATAGALFSFTDAPAQNSEPQETQRQNRRERDENQDGARSQETERDRRNATEAETKRQRSNRDRGETERSNGRDQQNRGSASDRRRSDDQSQNQDDDQQDQFADDESAELGLVAGSCPGAGVCVMGTAWGGPAQRAGIEHGDYILSVDDQRVNNPMQLKQQLDRRQPGDQIDVEIWRQGQTMQRKVMLAALSREVPRGQDAWIGVQIEANDDVSLNNGRSEHTRQSNQIRIASVQPDSPADEAGLQQGDVLTQIAGEDIDSFDTLMDQVQAAGPGQELELEVLRNGERQILTVDVGSIDDAPTSWQRRSFRGPEQMSASDQSESADQSVDAVLDRMRQQIRSLQQQVEQLQSNTGGTEFRDGNRDQEPRNQNRDQHDSAETRRLDSETQRETESIQDDNDVSLNSDLSADDRQTALISATSEQILVAQRSRYNDRNRSWRDRGGRRYSGSNWHNRNWNNRSNNRYHRSPRYGNSYYWNQGRPYYNNRGNRGGNRDGFRITPYGFSYSW